MAANTVLLDRTLAHYGPATGEVRSILRTTVAWMIDQVWPKNGIEGALPAQGSGELLFDKLQELVPRSDAQRTLQSQAESLAINLEQTRMLLFAQSGSSISRPFLLVAVLACSHHAMGRRSLRCC